MLLIKHAHLIMDEHTELFDVDIYIENGKILEIGQIENKNCETIDAKNHLVIPGMIDVHLHGSMGYDFTDGNQKVIDDYPIGKLIINNDSTYEIEYLDCSNMSVLLVDDNKLNLKVAEKLLKPYNFNVTTALSGKECIYKIKEGNVYDIIFLDHMMPEMDGIEVLHILKKLSKNFDIPPIVALTANAVTGMREIYLNEGFDEYVSKPINVNELNKVINKFFRRDNNE